MTGLLPHSSMTFMFISSIETNGASSRRQIPHCPDQGMHGVVEAMQEESIFLEASFLAQSKAPFTTTMM